GDVVDKGSPGDASVGQGGRDQPGVDAIETDITLEELITIMFDDLELPELRRKQLQQIMSDDARKRKGKRQAGIRPRLDKKATARNRIKRKLAVSNPQAEAERKAAGHDEEDKRFPFHQDDMRY